LQAAYFEIGSDLCLPYFPDMGLEDNIAMAQRHVDAGRRILQRQRVLIAQGTAGPDGLALLKSFERSQEIFEDDLNRLIRERDARRAG
jgi:predicted DNA-binding WGR domain protein